MMSLSALHSPSTHTYAPPRHCRYAPQTPSPLRTSRNANLMPLTPIPYYTSNAMPDSKSSPSSLTTPASTTSSGSRSDSAFTPRSTSTSTSALPFQFQNRSRSQSPQASLVKSNAAAKTRRSSLFLEKIRQKREDLRFETRGEQALRMDFVRERRAWEERLKRRAPSFDIEANDTLMDEGDQDVQERYEAKNHENAMPFPTEDKEIEELVSYLETDETRPIGSRASNTVVKHVSTPDHLVRHTMSDDEDYDQLFLEVIADYGGTPQDARDEMQEWCEPQQEQGSSMDLS